MTEPRAMVMRTNVAALRNGLAVVTGTSTSPWYALDERTLSLVFRADTPFEVWERETRALLEVARGIQWLVGDALAFGEDHYPDQESQLFDPDEYSYESVVRMARTSRAIPPERRRPTVSYSVHVDVAGLPIADQEAILDHAQEHHSTSEEVRTLARQVRRRLTRAAAAALPAPACTQDAMVLLQGDAQAIPLPDECVDLIVTSPPYGVEVEYPGGDISPSAWVSFMKAWLTSAHRVTKPHGRLALNVPLDTAKGGLRATYAQAVIAAQIAGWTYQSTIVWHDNATTKGNRALGSIDSSARPYHVSQVEMIPLFTKGEWGPSSTNPDDISSEDWQAAGRGPWSFPGETHPWESFPAAFPVALPRRLIQYLSRVGDHVLDPFMGSGTTAVACLETHRRCTGLDLDPEALASTRRRLALIGGG